jgi:hypothetical protein
MRRMIKKLWGPLTTLFPRAAASRICMCSRQIIIKKSPECLVLMQINNFLLLSTTGSHTHRRCTYTTAPRSNYYYCNVAQQVGKAKCRVRSLLLKQEGRQRREREIKIPVKIMVKSMLGIWVQLKFFDILHKVNLHPQVPISEKQYIVKNLESYIMLSIVC